MDKKHTLLSIIGTLSFGLFGYFTYRQTNELAELEKTIKSSHTNFEERNKSLENTLTVQQKIFDNLLSIVKKHEERIEHLELENRSKIREDMSTNSETPELPMTVPVGTLESSFIE